MKINTIQNASFKGYVRHNKDLEDTIKDLEKRINKKEKRIDQLWQDMLKLQERYVGQVNALKVNHIAVKEFDTFMRSDEVKEIVEKLPEDVDISEIIHKGKDGKDNTFTLYSAKVYGLTGMNEKAIAYYDKCQNNDGTINKEGIIAWLNNVNVYFETTRKDSQG